MSSREWLMANSLKSTPSASTPRSRRASTSSPIAQPASSAVLGWKSSIKRSAILPKKSSQNALRS